MPSSPPPAAAVLAARVSRQGLTRPLTRTAGVDTLFRRLQPVSTGALVRPGSPPRLAHRTRFDSEATLDRLRPSRQIVKGRFQGSGVGYVHADDLAVYANAFRKPLATLTTTQSVIFETLRFTGPLTSDQLKDETGRLKKEINPALQRLQEAFLVYEDQVSTDWERAWFEFASEWPDINLDDATRERDAARVLARFFEAFLFATERQVRDWTQWPRARVGRLLAELERDGVIAPVELAGLGTGWLDRRRSPRRPPPLPRTVFLLDAQDFIARAHKSELDERFGRTDVLQYLYAEARFIGAVRGHWGFKPFDIDDIVVELGAREAAAIRDEVLARVGAVYPPPRHRIRRYAGTAV